MTDAESVAGAGPGLVAGLTAAARLWWLALAVYVWLLPVGHTTAGRNLALLLLLATTLLRLLRRELALRLPLALPWLAYGSIALLSVIWSQNPDYVLTEIKVEVVFPVLVLAVAASGFRDGSDALRLAVIVALGNGFLVAYNLITGLTGGTTKDGLIGTLNTGTGNFSTYIVTVVPLLAAFAWCLWRQGRRPAAVTLGLLLLGNGLAMHFTLNRQGFVAMIVEVVVIGLLLLYRRCDWRRLAALGAAVAVLYLALLVQIEQRTAEPARTDIASTVAEDPRWPAWRFTVGWLADHPLTGTGFGQRTFYDTYGHYFGTQDKTIWHAHNLLLNRAVQMGLPGLAAFLWLFLAVPWRLRQGLGSGNLARTAALVGIAIAAGVFTKNMTDEYFIRGEGYLFWLLAGAAIALTDPRRDRP